MSGPDDNVPTPPPGSSSGDDVFEFQEEPKSQAAESWYAGTATGQRLGPFSLDELKRRMSAGEVASTDLVWRDGMPDWIPAHSVPELSDHGSRPGPPPPLTGRPSADTASAGPRSAQPSAAAGLMEPMGKLDGMFSRPVFFRIVGRASAALGALLVLMSLLTVFFWRAFFVEGFVLLLVFIVGEATGAILERLDRVRQDTDL